MSIDELSLYVSKIFKDHYSQCRELFELAEFEITPALDVDLYSVLYVVSGYAAFPYEKCKEHVSNVLLQDIRHILATKYPLFTRDRISNRVLFYAQALEGLDLHAHAVASKDVTDAHPILKCAIAFSDCCLYPAYMDDYGAPRPVLSALDVFSVSIEILDPLFSVFASLYKSISETCNRTEINRANRDRLRAQAQEQNEAFSNVKPPSKPQSKYAGEWIGLISFLVGLGIIIFVALLVFFLMML